MLGRALRSVLTLTLTLAVTAVGSVAVLPAATAAEGDLTFTGHGYGHGRGMGQYGALGYALDHGWSASRILGHFYGGTTLRADSGNPAMTVEIVRQTDRSLVVAGPSLAVNGRPVGAGAVLLAPDGAGAVTWFTGPGCGGPWSAVGTVGSGATVSTSADPANPANLLNLCEVGADHGYRGTLSAVVAGGRQYTVNTVPTETYLRGVVPRESPASWGNLGGGAGMQALMAQSVAARSYVLAPRGPRGSGARTCDTESCQVYLGATEVTNAGTRTSLEHPLTDQAIARTASQVMRHANGAVALTEFSSSTGGYTAGGTFPAVVDEGDDIAANPNHTWTVTRSLDQIATALGTGPIRSVAVTGRNGLGAEGGRVTSFVVTTTAGQARTFTGSQVRVALALRSDWFSVSGYTPAEAQAIVRALYEDLLGRAPDPTGLAGWTSALLLGTGQTALVDALTRSDEYVLRRITQAYREVLGREPDAAGLAGWHAQIRARRATVDDVQRRFYDSQEFFVRSGGTPEGYVDLLYRTMFDRPATAGESATWAAQIPVVGRSRVVDGIWFSFEAALFRAGGYYETFLRRAPDTGGQAAWAQVLLRDGEGAVRIGIAGSPEYRTLASVRFP